MLTALKDAGINPTRLRMIYSSQHAEGKLVIIEGGKLGNPELVVEEPFFIYKTSGGYSEAMQQIYDTV